MTAGGTGKEEVRVPRHQLATNLDMYDLTHVEILQKTIGMSEIVAMEGQQWGFADDVAWLGNQTATHTKFSVQLC